MIKRTNSLKVSNGSSLDSTLNYSKSRARNERQKVFELTRDLVKAQFELADSELINRIWQEISSQGIDIDRVINLMYGCSNHHDEEEMIKADLIYSPSLQSNI